MYGIQIWNIIQSVAAQSIPSHPPDGLLIISSLRTALGSVRVLVQQYLGDLLQVQPKGVREIKRPT
jgi:hypothetical protein